MRRLLALLIVCASCKSKPPPEPVSPEAGAVASAAPVVDSGAIRAATDDDKKRFAQYVDAVARGRKATTAKNYPDAVKAFDEALALRPSDARALAEKGYAELLAGTLDAASADLQAASTTTDPVLGSQVWFNFGLVDEAMKRTNDALIDFWFADKLHSSAATRAKIAGRTICPVKMSTTRSAAKRVGSWRDVAGLIRADMGEVCRVVPPTDADAKKALVMGTPVTVSGKGDFFLVRSGEIADCGDSFLYVVQVSQAEFWVYPEVGRGFRTYGVDSEDEVSLALMGPWVAAAQTSKPRFEHLVCYDTDAGQSRLFDCTGAPGEISAGHAFPESAAVYTDHLFDPDAHAKVLEVEDAASFRFSAMGDGGKQTLVRASGAGLEVVGLGCNLQLTRGDGGLVRH